MASAYLSPNLFHDKFVKLCSEFNRLKTSGASSAQVIESATRTIELLGKHFARWNEAEVTTFRTAHGVAIQDAFPAKLLSNLTLARVLGLNPDDFKVAAADTKELKRDDHKAERIEWVAGFKAPSYLYFQPHPETRTLDWIHNILKTDHYNYEAALSKFSQDIIEYRSALQHLQEVMQGKKLVEMAPKEILKVLNQINKYLSFDGQFRTKLSVVTNQEIVPLKFNAEVFSKLDEAIQAKSNQDFIFWKVGGLREKFISFVYQGGPSSFSPEECDFLMRHELVFAFPRIREIPELMRKFAKALHKLFQTEKDPYKIMSFIHQNLVQIHPYKDGNGRVARIFMNLVAQQAGIRPVLIGDPREYSKFAGQSVDEFAVYLKALRASQTNMLDSEAYEYVDQAGIFRNLIDRMAR